MANIVEWFTKIQINGKHSNSCVSHDRQLENHVDKHCMC